MDPKLKAQLQYVLDYCKFHDYQEAKNFIDKFFLENDRIVERPPMPNPPDPLRGPSDRS